MPPPLRRPIGWISALVSRLRNLVVLQDFWVPDGHRSSPGPQAGPGQTAATLVRRGTTIFLSVRAKATPGGGFYLTPLAGFEDGLWTISGSLPSGLGSITSPGWGSRRYITRFMALTGWLLQELVAIRHSNGAPLVHLRPRRHRPSRGDHRHELPRPDWNSDRFEAGRTSSIKEPPDVNRADQVFSAAPLRPEGSVPARHGRLAEASGAPGIAFEILLEFAS